MVNTGTLESTRVSRLNYSLLCYNGTTMAPFLVKILWIRRARNDLPELGGTFTNSTLYISLAMLAQIAANALL